ncbi:uncharacterized protein [Dermacentor andersoni]|uniref:uncharacterized protein isoform X4 n=1 Tax=Dermacentor andersoni TaxID=34620 RepID=UPI003B3B34A7
MCDLPKVECAMPNNCCVLGSCGHHLTGKKVVVFSFPESWERSEQMDPRHSLHLRRTRKRTRCKMSLPLLLTSEERHQRQCEGEAATSLAAGTVDHLRLAEYGEMGRECGRERCKSHGAVCESSSLGHLLLCACPTNMSVYDRFYDICHQGRTLHENCLFSEACSSADPDSRCVNGTCKCSEGLQSVGLGPCQRWASYGERCDRTVAGCTGLGVVCGPDSVCACERGRVRLNDSCVIQPEPESDSVTRLTPRQRVALISSVLITLTGVLLALVSLCSHLCQRCTAEGTSADDVASFKVPEWAEANSYYMSTRFWVSEQPYFSMAHRGVRRPPKMYFNW